MVIKNAAFCRSTYRPDNLNSLSLKMCLIHEWNGSDTFRCLLLNSVVKKLPPHPQYHQVNYYIQDREDLEEKECRVHCNVCKLSKISSFSKEEWL